MLLVDILILVFLVFFFLIGFRRGVLTELISLVGIIVIIILSFLFKNPISVFLYKFLFKNIFTKILILFKLLLNVTKILDKILKMSIIFTLPSKILGGLVGLIKGYLILFIVLYILSLPILPFEVSKTKIGSFMLDNTPGFNDLFGDKLNVFDEISNLVLKYKNEDDKQNFNQEALDLLIKYKGITKENAQDLIDSGKLKNLKVN